MPKIYSKCGYNRNTSRNVLYGPEQLGGAGFIPLKVATGTGRCLNFIKNWRTPTEDVGKTLRIVYAWTQYQAGVSYPLLEKTNTDLEYVQGRFVLETRAYLEEIDATIHLDVNYVQRSLRVNDVAIMEHANNFDFTLIQMKRINCVRMYLGVTYISEISTICGNYLVNGITN